MVELQSLKVERYRYAKIRSSHLMQRRRVRRRRRLVKNEFIFYKRNSRLSRSVRCANGSKNVLMLNMQRRRSIPNGNTKNQPSSSTFRRRRRTWSFHVVVLQRVAKKCTKICNARAQLLFSSLNLLFGGVLVAVVSVVCFSSLEVYSMLTCCTRTHFSLFIVQRTIKSRDIIYVSFSSQL